jgi:hypothetical protein
VSKMETRGQFAQMFRAVSRGNGGSGAGLTNTFMLMPV